MEPGAFFWTGDGIVDGDGDDISPVGFDCGTGKLAIDEDYVFLVAIRCYCASRNCEIVDPLLT